MCIYQDDEGICADNQRHDNIKTFEELGLDDIDNFSFGTVQEPISVPEVPLDLENDAQIEEMHTSQDQFEVAEVNLDGKLQHTTSCVWCGAEFNHESFDSEVQSDSVGYMCPSCKSRISGQINDLDNGSPMNSHHL